MDRYICVLTSTPNEGGSLQVVDKEEKTPEETKESITRLEDSLARNQGEEKMEFKEDRNIAENKAHLDTLLVSNRDSDVVEVDFQDMVKMTTGMLSSGQKKHQETVHVIPKHVFYLTDLLLSGPS